MRFVLSLFALLCLPACLLAADQKELVGDPKISGQIAKPKINDAAIDKAGFRIGVQAYTFREMSLYETLDLMKYLGIQCRTFRRPEAFQGKSQHQGGSRYARPVHR